MFKVYRTSRQQKPSASLQNPESRETMVMTPGGGVKVLGFEF